MNDYLTNIGCGPDLTAAEHSVIGAILQVNEAIDRIPELKPAHFYDRQNAAIYSEIQRQLAAGRTVDPVSLFEPLQDRVEGCLAYLNRLYIETPGASGIQRYAEIIIDRAIKRSMAQVAGEMQELAGSREPALQLVDRAAAKLDALAQQKNRQEPKRLTEALGKYADTITARFDGTIKPVPTGLVDLDRKLNGGLWRKTLTVVAGRPAMGKTAFGLQLARNSAVEGVSLFISMEMPEEQICDRNVAALGHLPVSWLMQPTEADDYWPNMTEGFRKADELNLFIDDETSLNMLAIRAKARSVKRQAGGKLDKIVIDQLSFITGSDAEKTYEAVGEYTRALLALAKELDCAVVLLCQLNRELEKRPNKRPIMSDLAMSGSIEQDAATIIFLYRDEVYNPDSQDKGICEVIIGKQRQGATGMVGLTYIGDQTRFENLGREFSPSAPQGFSGRRGKADI